MQTLIIRNIGPFGQWTIAQIENAISKKKKVTIKINNVEEPVHGTRNHLNSKQILSNGRWTIVPVGAIITWED